MQMIDRDIAKSCALVIDGNPTSRGLLSSQLREFGVGNVVQSGRIHDARRMLESRTFDIVLCEQEFEAEGYSGQNLLDDLRRLQLLPLSTVFVIVTGGASYTTVADAAESAVDSYLLKPYTAAALGERLAQTRKRKKSLGDIFSPIEAGDLSAAAKLCLKRFKERGPFHAYAARLGCELLLRLGEAEAARRLNEMVLEQEPGVPWARLGVARALIDANQAVAATRALEALVVDQPTYTDALDVLGRLQLEQGDLAAAAATYRRAAEFTRGSIVRLQRHGLAAFYAGLREECAKPIDRATVLGLGSRMFDAQVLPVQAALRYEQRDGKGLQRALEALQDLADKDPENGRLERLIGMAKVYGLAYHKQFDLVWDALQDWAAQLHHPSLDAEAACNLMTLWATLAAGGLELPEAPAWIDTLVARFASSRAMTELLTGAASIHPPFAAAVAPAQQAIATAGEQAMTHTLKGRPEAAVRALLDDGERTRNAKLVDLARLTLQRHQDKIDGADTLAQAIERLRASTAAAAALPSLGQTSSRTSGGLGARAPAAPAAKPA